MNRTWKLADVEFVALWQKRNDQILVEPFGFASTVRSYGAFLRQLAAIRTRLAAELGKSFDHVLDALERPDVRLMARGGVRTAPEHLQTIEMLVVRQGDLAFSVTQFASESSSHHTTFRVTECNPVELSNAVLKELPDVGAGSRPDTVISSDLAEADATLDYSYGRSTVLDYSRTTVSAGTNQFLTTPVTSAGTIEIVQGRSKFGPRGITRHRLEWRDLEGDGRYAITGGSPRAASGVTTQRLAEIIDQRIIEVIKVLNDERLR